MQSLRNLLLLGGLPFAAATLRAVVGRREKSLVAVFCTLLSFSALAQDDEYAREAERVANLLDKAVAYYREKGEAALAAFSRQGEFVDNELYVYVVDTHGVMLASGGSSVSLIGHNVSNVLGDELNRFFTEALAQPETDEMRQGEYRWLNWSDGKVQRKRVFYRRVGERIFAVGFYMPRSSKEEAVALLDRVSAAVRVDPEGTFERINSQRPDFAQDDLYVFVVDLAREKFIAHGYNRRLVGSAFGTTLSLDQQPTGRQMLEALNSGGNQGDRLFRYQWSNPATGRVELKNTLVRKVGDYGVAVGYYLRPTP